MILNGCIVSALNSEEDKSIERNNFLCFTGFYLLTMRSIGFPEISDGITPRPDSPAASPAVELIVDGVQHH
jgi:hypothetical protein